MASYSMPGTGSSTAASAGSSRPLTLVSKSAVAPTRKRVLLINQNEGAFRVCAEDFHYASHISSFKTRSEQCFKYCACGYPSQNRADSVDFTSSVESRRRVVSRQTQV